MRIVSVSIAIAIVLLAALSLTAPRAGAAGEYTVTDIGTLVGSSDGQFDFLVDMIPGGMNDQGDVAAFADGISQSVIWSVAVTSSDGKLSRIGKEVHHSQVFDISNDGVLVGFVGEAEFGVRWGNEQSAAVWREGKTIALSDKGSDRSGANAINDSGVIAGYALLADQVHVLQWIDDEPTDVGVGAASDLNNENVIVGRTNCNEFKCDGAVWDDGEMTQLTAPMNSAGYPIGGQPASINDAGVIVGSVYSAFPAQDYRAARWIDGEFEFLPTFTNEQLGFANDINEDGLIVGSVEGKAVVWETDEPIDLNEMIPSDSGYELVAGIDINASGMILAFARGEDGFVHSVVLNPAGDVVARIVVAPISMPGARLRDR